ncbi:MAG TPA: hypothetical protein VFZ21_28765 [Gemmatimonadaceae bacterium]|nr:hypothetical protein [Gemmatimonadaceae bacterium]
MTELHERDAMQCRACGNEERASEGYPCADCGRFICNVCNMRGTMRCADCATKASAGAPAVASGAAAPGLGKASSSGA